MRIIEGQDTRMARTMHQIAFDPVHDEIIAPNPFAEAILVFRGGADGEEPPLRIIQGPKTRLNTPDKVTVDPQNNEIYVPQSATDAILVFDREANGNVAPLRILHGPNTKLNGPGKVVVDPIHDLLFVIDETKNFLIFNRTDNGDVAPQAIFPTQGDAGGGPVRMASYPEGKKIFLRLSGEANPERGPGDSIAVWQYTTGEEVEVSLWAVIEDTTNPNLSIRGLGLHPEANEVMALVRRGGKPSAAALRVYHVPEVFE